MAMISVLKVVACPERGVINDGDGNDRSTDQLSVLKPLLCLDLEWH